MYPGENREMTLLEYRATEIKLHSEMMKICRAYINELGIVSIIGILDIVKQETIELEGATRRNIKDEEPESGVKTNKNTDNPLKQCD